jgi:hypothetical protein
MKKGTAGWSAAQARMYTRRGPMRLRVHEACVLHDDEQLGLSALTGAKCDRCKLAIQGAGTMVQRFSGRATVGAENEASATR